MTTDLKLAFAKITGAGNDFLVIDARSENFAELLYDLVGSGGRKQLARMICRRGQSVGADGMVLIETDPELDFSWDFYNSDGSEAEMCGNAARCVARFCFTKGITGREMKFRTKAGIIKAKVLGDNQVEVMMLPPKIVETDQPYLIDSGVPHSVIQETVLNDTRKLREIAHLNRFPKKAGPRGANVTFFAFRSPAKIDAISFERGVEDFTLACGTGAMAAAAAAKMIQPGESVFEVRMPGGVLEVEFPADQKLVLLRGPARFLAEGFLFKEACDEVI